MRDRCNWRSLPADKSGGLMCTRAELLAFQTAAVVWAAPDLTESEIRALLSRWVMAVEIWLDSKTDAGHPLPPDPFDIEAHQTNDRRTGGTVRRPQ